eukprot:578355_1
MTTSTNNFLSKILPHSATQVRYEIIEYEPWVCARDLAPILEISTAAIRNTIVDIDEENKAVKSVKTPGGPQSAQFVNVKGALWIIMTTRTNRESRIFAFKKWAISKLRDLLMEGHTSIEPQQPQISDREWLLQTAIENNKLIGMSMELLKQHGPDVRFQVSLMSKVINVMNGDNKPQEEKECKVQTLTEIMAGLNLAPRKYNISPLGKALANGYRKEYGCEARTTQKLAANGHLINPKAYVSDEMSWVTQW